MKQAIHLPGLSQFVSAITLSLAAGTCWAQSHDSHEVQTDYSQHATSMEVGKAPPDARDPHAYSGGFTLTDGPYAPPGPHSMKMADEHPFWAVLGDRLEYDTDNDTTVFGIQGWYGTSYERLVVKLEGDIAGGRLEQSQTDLLWGHAISSYFDRQLGVRLEQHNDGSNRQWLAVGIQGLAPYWFEVDVTAYLGENGRTALSIDAEYELLLSQRLILQPRVELNLYGGQDDTDNGIGSGLADAAVGLRLRYEFSRQFAPYIGIEWTGRFGDTADFARAADEPVRDTRFIAGVRFWF